MKEIECIVTGRVQLVLYRDFAQRRAWKHNLAGFVKNLPDGSVQVIAQGDEATLKQYVEELEKGSMFSRVENVSVSWRESTKDYDGFSIAY